MQKEELLHLWNANKKNGIIQLLPRFTASLNVDYFFAPGFTAVVSVSDIRICNPALVVVIGGELDIFGVTRV